MPDVQVKHAGEVAYREAKEGDGSNRRSLPVLLIHGYPESSFMWRYLLPPLAEWGRRAIAPDLPGYSNAPPIMSGTLESNGEEIEEIRQETKHTTVPNVVFSIFFFCPK